MLQPLASDDFDDPCNCSQIFTACGEKSQFYNCEVRVDGWKARDALGQEEFHKTVVLETQSLLSSLRSLCKSTVTKSPQPRQTRSHASFPCAPLRRRKVPKTRAAGPLNPIGQRISLKEQAKGFEMAKCQYFYPKKASLSHGLSCLDHSCVAGPLHWGEQCAQEGFVAA